MIFELFSALLGKSPFRSSTGVDVVGQRSVSARYLQDRATAQAFERPSSFAWVVWDGPRLDDYAAHDLLFLEHNRPRYHATSLSSDLSIETYSIHRASTMRYTIHNQIRRPTAERS
jgi:hypothetical protein